jgi:hypothetical protein
LQTKINLLPVWIIFNKMGLAPKSLRISFHHVIQQCEQAKKSLANADVLVIDCDMPSTEHHLSTPEMEKTLERLGVTERIAKLLFRIFPDGSFEPYFPLLRKAIEEPTLLRRTIDDFQIQMGLGVTSHIATRARDMLGSADFSKFTRDYVRRCCDLVEFFVKNRLLRQAGMNVERRMHQKSLGAIVHEFRNRNLLHIDLSSDLFDKLEAFDRTVYRKAKHEYLDSGETLFSVSDAVAVTFISIKLCDIIQMFCRQQ